MDIDTSSSPSSRGGSRRWWWSAVRGRSQPGAPGARFRCRRQWLPELCPDPVHPDNEFGQMAGYLLGTGNDGVNVERLSLAEKRPPLREKVPQRWDHIGAPVGAELPLCHQETGPAEYRQPRQLA